jgi:hydrogenase maturation protease
MAPTLILGIGNILLGDEGVGVRAVEALARRELPAGVEAVDGGTGGADLVEVIADRTRLIVIDAVAAGAEPGTVFRFTPGDLTSGTRPALSLHEFGLLETLAMAERLGCAPGEVVIFGVQPKTVAPGLELSPEVAAAVPAVIDQVLAELRP